MNPSGERDPFWVVGSVVARHRVLRLLGEGGMGAVYEGEHVELGDRRALKLCHASAENSERAVNEARAGAMLRHQAICAVHDLGWHGREPRTPVIVMDLLDGRTLLDEIVAAERLPWRRVLTVMAEVCDALAAAHSGGVIHRDVKPDNIFLTAAGAKVMDFGIAKLAAGTRTRTGMALGTPRYMSPEQARDSKRVDERTDIYACGVVMYRAIAGVEIFPGLSGSELLLAIVTREPRPFGAVAPPVPKHVVRLVQRCMARDRRQRFATALELRAAIARSLAAGDDELPEPRPPPLRAQTMALPLGATLLALVALVGSRATSARHSVVAHDAPPAIAHGSATRTPGPSLAMPGAPARAPLRVRKPRRPRAVAAAPERAPTPMPPPSPAPHLPTPRGDQIFDRFEDG